MLAESENDVNLWKINVMEYYAVLTLLQRHNQLKENPQTKKKPRWLEFQQQKVNSIRRKISYINLILQCRNHNTYLTKHQEKIQLKLKKWYCNTKTSTLISKATELKHKLNVTSQYIKNKKALVERSSINKKFQTNQKQVFREWKNKKIEIKETPSAEEIRIFWSNIWGKDKKYNKDAKWLPKLDKEYCKSVKPKPCRITTKTFKEVLLNMKNNGAPGNDKINAFYIKKLSSTHPYLISQFNDIFENNKSLPQWVVRGKQFFYQKMMI